MRISAKIQMPPNHVRPSCDWWSGKTLQDQRKTSQIADIERVILHYFRLVVLKKKAVNFCWMKFHMEDLLAKTGSRISFYQVRGQALSLH